jgi:hypothetical protein
MLRHNAPAVSRPYAALPLPGLIAAIFLVFSASPVLVAANSGTNSAVFTRIEQALKLSSEPVYVNVVAQAEGAQPAAPNGITGQITMFVILFTFLSAATLLMWRYARRDNTSPRRIGRRI